MELLFKIISLSAIFFILGNLFLTLITFITYLKFNDRHLKFYTISFGLLATAQMMMTLAVHFSQIIYLGMFAFLIVLSVLYLFKGVSSFLKLLPGHFMYLVFSLFIVLFILNALIIPTEQSFQIITFFTTAFYFFLISLYLLKTTDSFYRIVGIGFLIIGLLNVIYPFSRFDETFLLVVLFVLTPVSSLSYMGLLGIHFYEKYQTTIKKHKKLYYMSYHDHLTGLYNRHYIDKKIETLDRKNIVPIGIIIGDLNELKLVNDTYGHFYGDQLIIKTAERLKTLLPKGTVGRFGGDEFIVLLTNTDEIKTLEIIDVIKTINDSIIIEDIKATISLGYAIKEDVNVPLKTTIEAAEKKMYEQKRAS